MELTETQWQTIRLHTTAANYPGPGARMAPDVVVLTLAALLGNVDDIEASHTEFEWDAPTTWKTWAFTPTGLAYVQAEFEPANYDAIEDRHRRQPRNVSQPPAEPTALTARMLPLRTATSLAVTRVYHHCGVGPIGDAFQDFTTLEIEIGFGQYPERIGIETMFDDQAKRERWETFVAAARAAVNTGGTDA